MCVVKTCKLPEFFRWFKSFLVCSNLFVYTGIRRSVVFLKWTGTLFIYFISIDKAPSISQMLVLFWDSSTIPAIWIFKLLNKHPKIFHYLIKHSTIVTRFWHSFWIYTCDHNFHLLSSRLCFFLVCVSTIYQAYSTVFLEGQSLIFWLILQFPLWLAPL